jgi:membrane fusion protein, multidrug efflux system
LIAILAVVTAPIAAYVRLHQNHASDAANPPSPIPVIAATVERRDMPIVLTGLGTVTPFNTAAVRSQVL